MTAKELEPQIKQKNNKYCAARKIMSLDICRQSKTVYVDKYAVDTIEDRRTQIRRSLSVDLTIWSNFHIKSTSLRSASD